MVGPLIARVDRRSIDDGFKLGARTAVHHTGDQLDIQITHGILTCQIMPDDPLGVGTVRCGDLHHPVKASGPEKGTGQLPRIVGGGEDKDFTALQVINAGLNGYVFLGIWQIDITVQYNTGSLRFLMRKNLMSCGHIIWEP